MSAAIGGVQAPVILPSRYNDGPQATQQNTLQTTQQNAQQNSGPSAVEAARELQDAAIAEHQAEFADQNRGNIVDSEI